MTLPPSTHSPLVCNIHKWIGEPTLSSNSLQRYRCEVCGVYGWRNFWGANVTAAQNVEARGGRIRPIRPYRPFLREPRDEWKAYEPPEPPGFRKYSESDEES